MARLLAQVAVMLRVGVLVAGVSHVGTSSRLAGGSSKGLLPEVASVTALGFQPPASTLEVSFRPRSLPLDIKPHLEDAALAERRPDPLLTKEHIQRGFQARTKTKPKVRQYCYSADLGRGGPFHDSCEACRCSEDLCGSCGHDDAVFSSGATCCAACGGSVEPASAPATCAVPVCVELDGGEDIIAVPRSPGMLAVVDCVVGSLGVLMVALTGAGSVAHGHDD